MLLYLGKCLCRQNEVNHFEMRSSWIIRLALNQKIRVFIREDRGKDKDEDRGHGGGGRKDEATSQGTPGDMRSWKRQKAGSALEPWEGTQACSHLGF